LDKYPAGSKRRVHMKQQNRRENVKLLGEVNREDTSENKDGQNGNAEGVGTNNERYSRPSSVSRGEVKDFD